jgi:hypothetical protein
MRMIQGASPSPFVGPRFEGRVGKLPLIPTIAADPVGTSLIGKGRRQQRKHEAC